MLDRVQFTAHGSTWYELQWDPDPPSWPPGARYEEVKHGVVEIVLEAACDRIGNPDWRVLRFFGIQEHPANLDADELRGLVSARFRSACAPRLFRCRHEPDRVRGEPREPAEISPRSSERRTLGYLDVKLVSPGGRALSSILCEIELPDGAVCTVASDGNGRILLDRIPQGACRIRLPRHDADRWRSLDGAEKQIVRRDPLQTHVVREGECSSKIAHRYGVHDWNRIWQADANASLRSKRKSPHVLHPGDEIAIPGLEVAQIERSTDATHRIELAAALHELRVVLRDPSGRPFKNEAYEMRSLPALDPEPLTGTVDGQGRVIQKLPAETLYVEVVLPRRGLSYSFSPSYLAPLPDHSTEPPPLDGPTAGHALRAAQARLNALGLPCGASDGVRGPRTREALRLLQTAAEQREPTRDLDRASSEKLAELFTV